MIALAIDACVDGVFAQSLESAGFETVDLADLGAGTPDADILAHCASARLCIVTYDKGFSDHIFAAGLGAHGVVLVRDDFVTTAEADAAALEI